MSQTTIMRHYGCHELCCPCSLSTFTFAESGPTKATFDVDVSTCFNRVLQIYGGAMDFEHLHRGTEGGLSQTFFGSGPF